MTLVRQNTSGWSPRDRITAAQLNGIDAQLPKAIDGVSGGAYTPSGPVLIGGSGLALVNQLGYQSRSLTRDMPPNIWTDTSTRWQANLNSGSNSWSTITATGGALLFWAIDAPHGATITQVQMRFLGAGAHAGLPATMPQVQLGYWDRTTDAQVLVGAAGVDASGTTGAFQALHWITQSLAHVVDRSSRSYFATLRGEFGTNSLVGANVYICEVTASFTAQSEWM